MICIFDTFGVRTVDDLTLQHLATACSQRTGLASLELLQQETYQTLAHGGNDYITHVNEM